MYNWLAVAAGLMAATPPETKTCLNGAVVLLTQECQPPAFVDPFVVFFDFDGDDINPAAAAILENAVAAWQHIAGLSLALHGHADRSGPADYNLALSRRRANSVRTYLVRHGVPDGSIIIEALGESRPLVETADGMREPQNRRVEISFAPGGGR